MAKNDFKPFATGKGANVTSQPDWEALPALLSGFTAGKASSAQVNKALRQASFIAAALAQYTASKSGQDVLDDGDLSGFIAKMSAAFGKDFQTLDATLTALAGLATGADKLPYFTGNDTAGQTDLTSVGRDIIGKASIADILTYLGLGETINLAKNAVPATRRVNSKPLTGDITLSAGDVGALPIAGGRLNGPLGIGTDNALGGNSIVLGDNDTGFKQNGDGLLDIYANGVQVFRFQNDTLESKKSINVTGRLTPTDYGNFDSRFVQDIRLGSLQYGQVWSGPGFSDTSGYVITGIINGNSDELVDGAHRRPIQKLIGNQWYNVVSI